MGEHMSAGSCGGQKSTSDSLELDAGNQDYPQNSEFFFFKFSSCFFVYVRLGLSN